MHYASLNDLGNALEYFEKISDRSALASINVAVICYPDDIEKVIRYYENALRLDPSFETSEGVSSRLPSLESLKETLAQQKNVRSNKNVVIEKKQQTQYIIQPQLNQPQLNQPQFSSPRESKKKRKKLSGTKKVKNTQTTSNESGLFNTVAKVSLALGGALVLGYVLNKIIPRETTTTITTK